MKWDDISGVQEQFQLLVDLSSEVVFRVDSDANFEWVSPVSTRVTGWRPEDLVGRSSLDVVPPVGLGDMEKIDATLRGGVAIHYKGLFTHADGTQRWTEVEVTPVFADDGTLTGTVGVARDVHEEVLAVAALAESEAHYRLIADHASDVVLTMDEHLHMLWVSPSVTHLLGWEPAELVGTDVRRLVHPDDLPEAMRRGDRMLDPAHQPTTSDVFLVRVRAVDGRYRWMSSQPHLVRDEGDKSVTIVSNWSDVHDLVTVREEALLDRTRLRTTLDSLIDPHVMLEPVHDDGGSITDFVVIEANVVALEDTKTSSEEGLGARVSELLSPDDAERIVGMLRHVYETGQSLVIDDQPFGSLGDEMREHRYDVRSVKVGQQVTITWRDVTERHRFEERLSELALHDPLTGLANRAALLDELRRALVAGRRSASTTAVLMMDLDHFKFVNDTHGHGVGDELLFVAADRLRSVVRAGDLVARPGGDEFMVVMRDLTDPDEAFRVSARIVEEFRTPIRVDGHDLLTTASLGVAISTVDSTADELMREADVALYRAKENGRNGAAAYNEALRAAAGARQVLERDLRPALGLGELVVFFQPEVDLASGDVVGAEALLRWHHRSGQLFCADRFIDLAEESGLMIDIGRWALREGCRLAEEWSRTSPGRLRTLYLNLSRAQLGDGGLPTDLERILEETGIEPGLLCAEIAETALVNASSVVSVNLARIRDMGIRLAIDDFGRGDAALSHLRRHRVDAVKIDRTFVSEVDTDEYARRLVAGMAALAQHVGLAVVAEGVETSAQARVLRDLGCATAHGYLFAGAVPADDFPALLQRRYALD
jgi:diguanylate cyclase (GGDEF)-like protein/PAS domain S-box-containing protein